MKKRALSLLLCICMLLSLMPMGVFASGSSNNNSGAEAEPWVYVPESDGYSAIAESDDAANTLTVTVKAVNVKTRSNEIISGAIVKLVNDEKTLWTGKTGSDGTVRIPLSSFTEAQLRCATVTACKTMAAGRAIKGSGRDRLFNYFPKDSKGDYIRYEYELHSESIDKNGNWIGKQLPKLSSSQAVDIAFVIDATGSMSDDINNVKTNVANFADNLIARGLNVRFSIVEYRDITCGEPTILHTYGGSHWFTTAAAVQNVLGEITATGGGDEPETVIDALGIVAGSSMYWRSDARKFAFVLTDAGFKVDNNHGYSSMADLVKALKSKNIVTSVITTSSCQTDYASLVSGTGGIYANIYSSDFKAEMMTLANSIVGITNAKIELTLSEPRMLYNVSVSYLADDATSKGANYLKSVKATMSAYAQNIARTSNGHVLINKVILLPVGARRNFFNLDTLASMADVHIESKAHETSAQIRSNAHVEGFYDTSVISAAAEVNRFSMLPDTEDYSRGTGTYNRIQLSGFTGNAKSLVANPDYDDGYADTMAHESGHYIFGFFDEYLDYCGLNWNSSNRPYDNFGLMDHQFRDIELSRTDKDYSYWGSSRPAAKANNTRSTKQWYEHGCSTEDTLALLLETGKPQTYGDVTMDIGNYAAKYSKVNSSLDQTADYSYAYLSDSSFIMVSEDSSRSASSVRASATSATFDRYTETSANLADLQLHRSGDSIVLSMDAAEAENVKVYASTDGINFDELIFTADASASDLSPDDAQLPGEIEIPEETTPEETEAPAEEPAEEEDVLTEDEEAAEEGTEEATTAAAEEAEEVIEDVSEPAEEAAEEPEEAAVESEPAEEPEETESEDPAPAEEAEPVEGPEEEDAEEAMEAAASVQAVISDISGNVIELRVLSSASGSYNSYYADCTESTGTGALYSSLDNAVAAYANSKGTQSFLFLADNRSYTNGSYVSVNQATQISAADGEAFNGGEIYSVADLSSDINFSTLSWFVQRTDGSWEKLPTDISEEENMNPGARADISGEGTYVLMAQKASGTARAVTVSCTNSDTVDGVVTLNLSDPNSSTKFYNVYFSDSPFSTRDASAAVRTYKADSTSLTLNLYERERAAFVGVEAVLENGNRSPLTMITVDTGSVDRDHDGVPDWFCDEYLLWGEDGVEKNIAKSDDDGDGLTNLEEFRRGSNPKDPNDPVQTTNVPVQSIELTTRQLVMTVGSQQKITAKITPSDATNKNIYWMIENPGIASISGDGNDCTITGTTVGSTVLYAVSHDGGFAESCTITVVDGLDSLHLSQEYLAMTPDSAPVQLQVLPIPAESITDIRWVVLNADHKVFEEGTEVITLSEDGTVTPVRQGTAYVLAVVSIGKESATVRCRVDVVEGSDAHPIASEVRVNGAFLADTKVTTNLYSTEYARVNLVLNLDQNLSAFSDSSYLGNVGSAIEYAAFADYNVSRYFSLRVADDRSLEIIPTSEALYRAKDVKSSYKSAIRVTVDGSTFNTAPLTLTVKKTLPKLKAATVKINSYSPVASDIAFTGGTVTALRSAAGMPGNFALEGMRVVYTGSAAKASAKLKLVASVLDWAVDVPVTVSVSVSRTDPVITLHETDPVDISGSVDAASTSGTLSGAGTMDIGITPNLILAPPKPAPVPVAPTIPAPSGPKKVTSVTLLPGTSDKAQLKIRVTPLEYNYRDLNLTLTDSKGKPVSEDVLNCRVMGEILHLSVNDSTPYGATYKLVMSVAGSAKKTTLTIKTAAEKVKPTLSLKATGSIDCAVPDSPITLKPTVSNFHTGSGEHYLLSVIRNDGTDVTDLFSAVWDNGSIILTAAETLPSGYTYSAKVGVDLDGDYVADSEKTVKLNIKWSDASRVPVSVSLKASGSIDTVKPGSSITLKPTIKNWYRHELSESDLVFCKAGMPLEEAPFKVTVEDGAYVITNNGADSSAKYTAAFSAEIDGKAVTSKPIALSVKMSSVKITQSAKAVTLLKKDRFDSAAFRLEVPEGYSGIASVQQDLTSAAQYRVQLLSNGSYFVEYTDHRIAPKAGTVKLQVFLEGNLTGKPNATISIKVNLK